jgi:hypothetical protein
MKKLDENTKVFTANGNKYIFTETLTVYRFWQFERYKRQLEMSMNLVDIYNVILDCYENIPKLMRDPKDGMDLHYRLRNVLSGLNDLNKRIPVAFYMSTLFWNREGEVLSEWDEAMAEEKISDWNIEEIDATFFLRTCLPHIKNFLIDYKNTIANYLEVEQEEEELLITLLNLENS